MSHVSLDKRLKNLLNNKVKVRKLKLETGQTIEDLLLSQAKLLISIIKDEIQKNIYDKPQSTWYDRTGDLLNSVDEMIQIDKNTNTISITFLPDMAWRESAITKYRNPSYSFKAFVPMMVNEGFHVLDTSDEYMWTKSNHWYNGTHFLEKAVDRFNKEKSKGITVKLNKPDMWW